MQPVESVGTASETDSRIEALREDLRVDIRKLTPTKGDVLVVSAKNPNYILSDQYIQFLGDNLQPIANGAYIIIGDHMSKLSNVKPPTTEDLHKHFSESEAEAYLSGWRNALVTLNQVMSTT